MSTNICMYISRHPLCMSGDYIYSIAYTNGPNPNQGGPLLVQCKNIVVMLVVGICTQYTVMGPKAMREHSIHTRDILPHLFLHSSMCWQKQGIIMETCRLDNNVHVAAKDFKRSMIPQLQYHKLACHGHMGFQLRPTEQLFLTNFNLFLVQVIRNILDHGK